MSEIQRLLRIAAGRNKADEYTAVKFRFHRELHAKFRERLAEDSLSGNAFIEAVARGYVNRHPAVLAMIDQWIRDERGEDPQPRTPPMSKRDIDEIYAAVGSGTIAEEDL